MTYGYACNAITCTRLRVFVCDFRRIFRNQITSQIWKYVRRIRVFVRHDRCTRARIIVVSFSGEYRLKVGNPFEPMTVDKRCVRELQQVRDSIKIENLNNVLFHFRARSPTLDRVSGVWPASWSRSFLREHRTASRHPPNPDISYCFFLCVYKTPYTHVLCHTTNDSHTKYVRAHKYEMVLTNNVIWRRQVPPNAYFCCRTRVAAHLQRCFSLFFSPLNK